MLWTTPASPLASLQGLGLFTIDRRSGGRQTPLRRDRSAADHPAVICDQRQVNPFKRHDRLTAENSAFLSLSFESAKQQHPPRPKKARAKNPQKTGPVFNGGNGRTGMTLIEVMVSISILAIFSIMSANAFFYSRYSVVNSRDEQSAILSATTKIERLLYTSTPCGEDLSHAIKGITGDSCKYLPIHVTIGYGKGESVELVTYRSLEIRNKDR